MLCAQLEGDQDPSHPDPPPLVRSEVPNDVYLVALKRTFGGPETGVSIEEIFTHSIAQRPRFTEHCCSFFQTSTQEMGDVEKRLTTAAVLYGFIVHVRCQCLGVDGEEIFI